MNFLNIPDVLIKNGQGGASFLYSVLAIAYFAQNKWMLYIPEVPGFSKSPKFNPPKYRSPKERGIPFDDVFIKTEDGVNLHGWFLKQENSKNYATIIFYHENAGNIGERLDYLQHYYFLVKVNILIIAYRGFSDSEGMPSESGLQKDSIAILNYAFNHPGINAKKIFTHGRSLGGATSIYGVQEGKFDVKLIKNELITKTQVAGVILENTFTSIEKMMKHLIPSLFIFAKYLLKSVWNSDERIAEIKQPILFIKSLQDELVPYTMMEDLKNNAIKAIYKEEYSIELGDHNGNWALNPIEYFEKVKDFILKFSAA